MSIKIGSLTLRPELNEFRYWVHLVILSATVLGVLQLWKGGDMFTIKNVLMSVPLLALGDMLAHTILQMD
jgi:hypothetical protein